MINDKTSDNEDTQVGSIESPTECPTCDGTGIISLKVFDTSGVFNCPHCGGSGSLLRGH